MGACSFGGTPTMSNRKNKEDKFLDKVIDFTKQLFAGIIKSRTGSLTEIAKLLRFQTGTKGFERMYEKVLPIIEEIKQTFTKVVLENLPKQGLRLAILDDSSIKKVGKLFPKQQIHHDSSSNTFYSGMKALSSAIYQNGKMAVIDSTIVGKNDNKLEVAIQKVDMLIAEYFAEIFLFDAWYCKNKLLEHIQKKEKLFVSRARKDTKAELDEDLERLDALFNNTPHKDYEQIKINGKSYWIIDAKLNFKAYGELRVIISKEAQHAQPVFLLTNAYNFKASFIVKLYLKRFCIEIFFKDAKQFLNFETFLCRRENKWNMHLLLTNILHFGIQIQKSISKTVRNIRECINKCSLFINQNMRFQKFFDELEKRCRT
jgi:hypothetical protein